MTTPAEGHPQPGDRGRAQPARRDAREKFGGFNWGSAFFGWLVAVAASVLLLAIVGAIGGPVGALGR